MKRFASFVFVISTLVACRVERPEPERPELPTRPPVQRGASSIEFTVIESPATSPSAASNVTSAPDGPLFFSWVQKGEKTSALHLAHWNGSAWAAPVVVATDVSGNWADFPSIAASSANDVAAIWSRRLSAEGFGTETLVARSSDGGKSWSSPVSPHDDKSDTIHGFSSLVALSSGSYGFVWLDGRKMKPGTEEGEMTVRYAELSAGGSVSNQKELDSIACECCQTGLATTADGAVAVYRDRSPEGIRDIALTNVATSKPLTLGPDGWKIDGCPVNGPQVDARGNLVAAAWFTGAPVPRVRLAFSGDGGKTFGDVLEVASGSGVKGRVDVVLVDDGEAIVTWLRSAAEGTELFATKVSNGAASSPTRLATTAASAVPRMARASDGVYVTWTDAEKKVRIGRMNSKQ